MARGRGTGRLTRIQEGVLEAAASSTVSVDRVVVTEGVLRASEALVDNKMMRHTGHVGFFCSQGSTQVI